VIVGPGLPSTVISQRAPVCFFIAACPQSSSASRLTAGASGSHSAARSHIRSMSK
jgi:hypothetical protein